MAASTFEIKKRKAAGGNIHRRHTKAVTEIKMLKVVLHVMGTQGYRMNYNAAVNIFIE
jgi:hypothetical protein